MSSCVHVVVKGTCAVRNLRAEFQLTNVAGWIKWIVDSRLGKKINFGLILGANEKSDKRCL